MLALLTLVGDWIATGHSLQAYLVLAEVLGSRKAAWSMSEAWPHIRFLERFTGWTPEVWALRLIMAHVADWQSRDWTELIARYWRRVSAERQIEANTPSM